MVLRSVFLLGSFTVAAAFAQVSKPAAVSVPISPEVVVWNGYGGDSQHSAQSRYAMAPISGISWSFPIDLNPPYSGTDLLEHYCELALTTKTAILPQRAANGKYNYTGLSVTSGTPTWIYPSTYVLPPSNEWDWTPPAPGTLLPNGSYVGGVAGGGVFMRAHVDSQNQPITIFHHCGAKAYALQQSTYDTKAFICTPITSDSVGSVYYGVHTLGTLPDGMQSGIVKMTVNGTFTLYSSPSGYWPAMNAGPAVSPDGKTVYIVESMTNAQAGRIVALDAATLQFKAEAPLLDPPTGNYTWLSPDSTASPLVGPDGDVFFGVLDLVGMSRGWLLHFHADLTNAGVPGAFGWDDTPSIVPLAAVPSYHGAAKYLLFCKYNNYADPGTGGNGRNMVAVLDPTASSADPRYPSQQVMNPVIEVVGVTPDSSLDIYPNSPNAVREWCINSAAVDAIGKCIAVNSEDGSAYRLDLTTGTLTNKVALTAGIGEAYTPTAIGSDGTVYAVSNARLFAIRPKPIHLKPVVLKKSQHAKANGLAIATKK